MKALFFIFLFLTSCLAPVTIYQANTISTLREQLYADLRVSSAFEDYWACIENPENTNMDSVPSIRQRVFDVLIENEDKIPTERFEYYFNEFQRMDIMMSKYKK